MASITEGLFPSVAGLFAPIGTEQTQRLQAAGQPRDPLQAVSGNIGFLGERMQQGIGATFGQMPEADKKRQVFQQLVQQLQQQGVDISTPQGLVQLAQQMSSIPGFEGEALGLRQRAAQMTQQTEMQGLEAEKTKAQTAKAKAEAEKAGRVTEGGQKGVVLPAGGRVVDPVTGRIIAEGAPQREAAEKVSPEFKKYSELLRLGTPEPEARAIAYKTATLDFRKDLEEFRRNEAATKKNQLLDTTVQSVDNVMSTVETALNQTGLFTAGLSSPIRFIPGTPAKDLAANITTIKANLGFDRLQQMRDASPTGGALGQVAVQELVALESTVASLDQEQSPTQLKKNLEKIKRHYNKWRETVRKAQEQNKLVLDAAQQPQTQSPISPSASPTVAPQAQPQQPRRFRFNPATGRVE